MNEKKEFLSLFNFDLDVKLGTSPMWFQFYQRCSPIDFLWKNEMAQQQQPRCDTCASKKKVEHLVKNHIVKVLEFVDFTSSTRVRYHVSKDRKSMLELLCELMVSKTY